VFPLCFDATELPSWNDCRSVYINTSCSTRASATHPDTLPHLCGTWQALPAHSAHPCTPARHHQLLPLTSCETVALLPDLFLQLNHPQHYLLPGPMPLCSTALKHSPPACLMFFSWRSCAGACSFGEAEHDSLLHAGRWRMRAASCGACRAAAWRCPPTSPARRTSRSCWKL
jgi:hypothetical protein